MSFIIKYHPRVVNRDIPRLDKIFKVRIRTSIETKLMKEPLFYGIPLRSTLKAYWKLRVGDYRVVYTILGKVVYVLVISHRKDVYSIAEKRF